MPVTDYPITMEALTPRKQENFAEAIVEMEAAIETGAIANARFQRIKETLSRSVEYAWQERANKPYSWNRDYIARASDEERDALNDFSSYPQVNTIGKMNRQADKLGDTEAARAIRCVLAEANPIFGMIRKGKEIAVKKTAAPPPESAVERYPWS